MLRLLTAGLLGCMLGSVVALSPPEELLFAAGWVHVLNAHMYPLLDDASSNLHADSILLIESQGMDRRIWQMNLMKHTGVEADS